MYINGQSGFDNHYGTREGTPCTLAYCDSCGPKAIGFEPLSEDSLVRNPYQTMPHYCTGFSWTPYSEMPCAQCGQSGVI